MTFEFLLGFIVSFIIVVLLTPLIRQLALWLKIIDYPDQPRKIQEHPTPSLGGLAVYLGFAFVIALWLIFSPAAFQPHIKVSYLVGILLGGLVLIVGGYLDDRYRLMPRHSIIAPVLAVLILILSEVQLSYINNPLGGAISLDVWKILGYPVLGGIFIYVWILGMIYTTKFLDGMDGLVSGTVGIGAIVLFFVSQLPVVSQPGTALLCIIFAGAILGFLPWNFHPAKIFLGEGGSTFAGFVLGTLAVIAGGKIATALLVMGVPILDVVWVIVRRVINRFSPFEADRKHLHFRLLDLGLSQRQTVLLLYFISVAFGVSGVFLQSREKLIALFILLGVMLVLGSFVVVEYNKKVKNLSRPFVRLRRIKVAQNEVEGRADSRDQNEKPK